MSKYTVEQVRDWHRKVAADLKKSEILSKGAPLHDEMADTIDTFLREREAAKARVTDIQALLDNLEDKDIRLAEMKDRLNAIETINEITEQNIYDGQHEGVDKEFADGWNSCLMSVRRKGRLAAAPKPEAEE